MSSKKHSYEQLRSTVLMKVFIHQGHGNSKSSLKMFHLIQEAFSVLTNWRGGAGF